MKSLKQNQAINQGQLSSANNKFRIRYDLGNIISCTNQNEKEGFR